MTRKEILTKVVAAIKSIDPECVIDNESINEATKFGDDLDFDSLSLLMLTSALEEGFNIRPSDRKITSFNTIGDVLDYIESHMNK